MAAPLSPSWNPNPIVLCSMQVDGKRQSVAPKSFFFRKKKTKQAASRRGNERGGLVPSMFQAAASITVRNGTIQALLVPYSTYWTVAPFPSGARWYNAYKGNSPSICFDKTKWETLEGACGSFIALHCLSHHFPARIKHLIEWIPVPPPPPDPTCCPVLDDPQELVRLLALEFIHLPLPEQLHLVPPHSWVQRGETSFPKRLLDSHCRSNYGRFQTVRGMSKITGVGGFNLSRTT